MSYKRLESTRAYCLSIDGDVLRWSELSEESPRIFQNRLCAPSKSRRRSSRSDADASHHRRDRLRSMTKNRLHGCPQFVRPERVHGTQVLAARGIIRRG